MNKNTKKKYKKINNNKKHAENGNIKKSIKIATWNKGPSMYRNAILNIQNVLQTNKIDILALQ